MIDLNFTRGWEETKERREEIRLIKYCENVPSSSSFSFLFFLLFFYSSFFLFKTQPPIILPPLKTKNQNPLPPLLKQNSTKTFFASFPSLPPLSLLSHPVRPSIPPIKPPIKSPKTNHQRNTNTNIAVLRIYFDCLIDCLPIIHSFIHSFTFQIWIIVVLVLFACFFFKKG